jgi:hypothetical protein
MVAKEFLEIVVKLQKHRQFKVSRVMCMSSYVTSLYFYCPDTWKEHFNSEFSQTSFKPCFSRSPPLQYFEQKITRCNYIHFYSCVSLSPQSSSSSSWSSSSDSFFFNPVPKRLHVYVNIVLGLLYADFCSSEDSDVSYIFSYCLYEIWISSAGDC